MAGLIGAETGHPGSVYAALLKPEGGLGPWLRTKAGFGDVGHSETYSDVSLGLDGGTFLASFAVGGASKALAPPKLIKHHIFNKFRGKSPKSQKYRDFFAEHGIPVDKWSVEIPESMHKTWIHGAGRNWTTQWKRWIDANPSATTREVYQRAGKMMDDYGLSGLAMVHY